MKLCLFAWTTEWSRVRWCDNSASSRGKMSSRWAHALKILVSPRLVSSRIWTHAASDAIRDQVPHCHYDHPHRGAPRRKCLHRLHTLTLWSPDKTFQSTCKRELSNHFMIDINAEKLTSQPRRIWLDLKCCFPDMQRKVHSDPKIRNYGGWWHQGPGVFWLKRKLEAQCAPWYICWPHCNTAQCTSLITLGPSLAIGIVAISTYFIVLLTSEEDDHNLLARYYVLEYYMKHTLRLWNDEWPGTANDTLYHLLHHQGQLGQFYVESRSQQNCRLKTFSALINRWCADAMMH